MCVTTVAVHCTNDFNQITCFRDLACQLWGVRKNINLPLYAFFSFFSSFPLASPWPCMPGCALVLESHWQPALRMELKFPPGQLNRNRGCCSFSLQHEAGTLGLVCLLIKLYLLFSMLVFEKLSNILSRKRSGLSGVTRFFKIATTKRDLKSPKRLLSNSCVCLMEFDKWIWTPTWKVGRERLRVWVHLLLGLGSARSLLSLSAVRTGAAPQSAALRAAAGAVPSGQPRGGEGAPGRGQRRVPQGPRLLPRRAAGARDPAGARGGSVRVPPGPAAPPPALPRGAGAPRAPGGPRSAPAAAAGANKGGGGRRRWRRGRARQPARPCFLGRTRRGGPRPAAKRSHRRRSSAGHGARSPPVAGAACAREPRRRMAVLKLADQVGAAGRAGAGGGLSLSRSPRGGAGGRGRPFPLPGAAVAAPSRGAPCGAGSPLPAEPPPMRFSPLAGGHCLCAAGRGLGAGQGAARRGRGSRYRALARPCRAAAPRSPVKPWHLPSAGWDGGGCRLVPKGLSALPIFPFSIVSLPCRT